MASGEFQTVTEFYKNKKIFVTGGTGFIGKIFIEKLLRCCDVEGIYCLIRPKKGKDPQERLDKICEDKLFDRVIEIDPDFSKKLHAIQGDITEEELGIKDSDKKFLEENIQIVVHSAATVRFDEQLKLAVNMNIIGVQRMVKLSKGLQKLEVFVHISTAYANCDRDHIDEVIYPPPVQPQKIIDAMEWMSDDAIEVISADVVSPKPNTYTFTKQLAESLLITEGADLPLCIVRPSIVTCSWEEPYQGWVDNYNGVTGLGLAIGKGLLQTCRGNPDAVADLVPVDLVANLIISSAWYTVVHKPPRHSIYHMTSGGVNPATWGALAKYTVSHLEEYPMQECFRRPKRGFLQHKAALHNMWMYISHLLPASIVDLGFILMGKKPRMLALYRKIHKAMGTLQYFILRQWKWTHDNTDRIRSSMSAEDQQVFKFDPCEIVWPKYIQIYCLGIQKYILKEDIENTAPAKAHIRKLRNIRYFFNVVSAFIVWKVCLAKTSLAKNFVSFLFAITYKMLEFMRLDKLALPAAITV